MDAPKYSAGQVIDLRFTRNSMPDRIYITMVYMKPSSICWMYRVESEMRSGIIYMRETDIDRRASKKQANCYSNDTIISMYQYGFRWCGNYTEKICINRAKILSSANYIKNIIICDAIDKDGNIIDGYKALWVRYNIAIDSIGQNLDNKFTVIK